MRFLLLGIFLTYFSLKSNAVTNNVCATYNDYYTFRTNPNCWYDLAAEANATEIIKHYGYPLETHKATTLDGYIITLFRIPNHNAISKKGPVYVQHGLLASSANFVGLGKNSLAFVLADAGYDVWLGNYRGNEYSEEHVNLTVYDKKYWEYSIDDIGLYDIPAVLNLIAQKTGQKGNIVYIGHSLGTTIGMIYSSGLPQQAKENLKLIILLAPAASLKNMISPIKAAAPLSNQAQAFIKANDMIRLVSQASAQRQVVKLYCMESPVLMQYCMNSFNLFYGPYNQMPASTVPVFFNQFPGGSSFNLIKQASDFVSKPFGKYDYGFAKNMEKYGTPSPPEYDVSKIQVPVFIMYADNDWCCGKKDALILYNKLSPKVKTFGLHAITTFNFNHADFLFGANVKSIVYDKILTLLDRL